VQTTKTKENLVRLFGCQGALFSFLVAYCEVAVTEFRVQINPRAMFSCLRSRIASLMNVQQRFFAANSWIRSNEKSSREWSVITAELFVQIGRSSKRQY